MSLDTLTTAMAAVGTAAALVAMCWRALAKLHDFVGAVAANTTAVVQLGERLEQHVINNTSALTALEQRVTHLENP